ncbi:MAG: flippase [Cyanobacteria bacterium P01_A01_bin.3]
MPQLLYSRTRSALAKLVNTHPNLLYQGLGQGLGKALTLAYTLLLPKWIGMEAYGVFAFLFAAMTLAVQPAIDLGLDLAIVKKSSRGDLKIVKEAFLLRGVGAILAGAVVMLAALYFEYPVWMFLGLYLHVFLTSLQKICFAYQRGQEQMQLEGILTPLGRGLALLLLFWFFRNDVNPLLQGPVSLAIAAIATCAITFYQSRQWLRQCWQLQFDWSSFSASLKEGLLLMSTSLLAIIYFRIDTIMLGFLRDLDAVAPYNVAYRLIEGLIYFPSILMIAFFPRLARAEQFKATFRRLLASLSAMGIALSLAVYLIAGAFISQFYGVEWLQATPLLKVLALSLFPICLGHLGTQALIALDRQHLYFMTSCVAVLVNIVLNFGLIPIYGALGAAWATVITESCVVLMCFYPIWFKLAR